LTLTSLNNLQYLYLDWGMCQQIKKTGFLKKPVFWDRANPTQYCSVKESSGWDEQGEQGEQGKQGKQGKQGGRESCLSEQYCNPTYIKFIAAS
jgi:hypothetical protein